MAETQRDVKKLTWNSDEFEAGRDQSKLAK